MVKHLTLPLTGDIIEGLTSGDEVTLTGKLFIMRDAAQARLLANDRRGLKANFDLTGSVVLYAGPTPSLENGAVNSIGPTTSKRMDRYLDLLSRSGVVATIGKGERTPEGMANMKSAGMIYLVIVGGAAAMLSKHFKSLEAVDFTDLGPEAVYAAEVDQLPAYVAFDRSGQDLFSIRKREWELP